VHVDEREELARVVEYLDLAPEQLAEAHQVVVDDLGQVARLPLRNREERERAAAEAVPGHVGAAADDARLAAAARHLDVQVRVERVDAKVLEQRGRVAHEMLGEHDGNNGNQKQPADPAVHERQRLLVAAVGQQVEEALKVEDERPRGRGAVGRRRGVRGPAHGPQLLERGRVFGVRLDLQRAQLVVHVDDLAHAGRPGLDERHARLPERRAAEVRQRRERVQRRHKTDPRRLT
jgi:hypothetical protein